MVILNVSDQCYLSGLTNPEAIHRVLNALRFRNPEYVKARRQGRPCFQPEYLCLAEQKDGTITFPREARREILPLLPEMPTIQDRRLKLNPVQFAEPNVEWRDYQETAINIACRVGCCVIEAPCGAGKTNIAHGIVAKLQQPTLWLTHKKDLLEQSMARANALLGVDGADVGTITEGHAQVGRKITFATVQTMANLPDSAFDMLSTLFGLVLVDECHHCFQSPKAVAQFAKCVNRLPAWYRIGITATAQRSDGLEKTMHWLLGPTAFSVPGEKLETQGYIIKPVIQRVDTQFDYVQTRAKVDFNDLLSEITNDRDRNYLLMGAAAEQVRLGNHVLVLTARVGHAEYLRYWLEVDFHIQGALVTGATKMDERERIYAAVRDGTCRILIATSELAKEGLDLPRLDTLVFATPHRDPVYTVQAVGRVMRPCDGKEGALVLDFVDKRVKLLRGQWYARKKVYQEKGWEVQEGKA